MADKSVQAGSTLVGLAGNSTSLQDKVTKAATFRPTDKLQLPERFNTLIVVLNIFSAVHTDETYDFYITTTEGPASWDIVHFLQVATTGAKTFVARVHLNTRPQTVTATTLAEEASLLVSSTNAIETLAANAVRHGPIGRRLGHSVVIAGSAPSVVYEILVRGE